MKKNRFYLLAGVLGLFVTTLAVSSLASAYQGKPNFEGQKRDPIKHEAMVEAIESGDYQTWADLHQDNGKMLEFITEDNFSQFATLHQLKQDGNYEEAKALWAEMDFPDKKKGFRKGFHRGMRAGDCLREE
ncbi:hypothetical protein HOB10_01535 [Candidatus Parcubacteria bacterium]|jgi:hypothetical protein|nr:hypothetical protein [Candidatus Parcubacteria bacterium]